jgi:hypothetical protein
MRIGRHSWFTLRAALAMFAVVVQTLLPFVLAGAIAGAAGATPICHASTPGERHDHQPVPPAKSCPICAALAAAIAAPASPPLPFPLPRVAIIRTAAAAHAGAADIATSHAYRSRAPPLA